jgi:hypothetical protein
MSLGGVGSESRNNKSSLLLSFKKEESSFLKKRRRPPGGKQKTFLSLSRFYPTACRQEQKFFGSFFKKEPLCWLLSSIGSSQRDLVLPFIY